MADYSSTVSISFINISKGQTRFDGCGDKNERNWPRLGATYRCSGAIAQGLRESQGFLIAAGCILDLTQIPIAIPQKLEHLLLTPKISEHGPQR